uniref:F-box domain-containing protein n=1 Tax=Mola mola TaxID=94237 RepID=A0A3Q3XPM5_MOLML
MTSAQTLPDELWLHVFSFLSWTDKLSARSTCSHFRQLLDKSRTLWREKPKTQTYIYTHSYSQVSTVIVRLL